MLSYEATRTPVQIKRNNLPKSHLGQWLSDAFKFESRIKPPFDDNTIMMEVCPSFIVFDGETRKELYRFETITVFTFSGLHSKSYLRGLIYYLICLSIDEFNVEFKKTKSLFAISREYKKPSIEEIDHHINDAFNYDFEKNHNVVPHWKIQSTKTEEENDEIISTLIPIPTCKQFTNNPLTVEGTAVLHCSKNAIPDPRYLEIVKEAIEFYKACFLKLKQIDLRILNDRQCEKIKEYLNYVLNMMPTMHNDVTVPYLYRVTIIKDEWQEDGKLKDTKFLYNPPLKLVKEAGVYNRANTPNTTLFYASTLPNVAVREIHPATGKRIILSTWVNKSVDSLNAFPLCLTAGIINEYADANNYAFEIMTEKYHPVYSEWMECFFTFFSSEFIKETEPVNPKRYDYLFSAYFADRILQQYDEKWGVKSFDCIVYPSVAGNHRYDNLAIIPEALYQHFALSEAKEYEVLDTWYDEKFEENKYPAELKQIRHSKSIKNGCIIWNDD